MLIGACKILGVDYLLTEQNPIRLGSTNQSLLKVSNKKPIPKLEFSCDDSESIQKILSNERYTDIIISGVETHVCVQQTAIDLIERGFNVFLILDSIGSRGEVDHITAIRRMEQAGCILSTAESIIFEWCKTSDRKEFKEISNLIKEGFNRKAELGAP
tara:strand:- start:176 stop:649 length:474 start_codon:yes stop_codon:yes gene_type:complete